MLAPWLLSLGAKDGCCWCDPDTPKDAEAVTGSDGDDYTLVFSDEFNDPSRSFANGEDPKWTALEVGDTSNLGSAFYLPEQATVLADQNASGVVALRILTEEKPHTGDSPTGEKNIHMPYSSAMLQSWNKFCFTGGIVEFRAKLPGGGGYWPALWAFGNLGRAVYQDSNTGLWPWSYSECDPDLKLPPTDPPQRISACQDHDLREDGLLPFQGRGATELDVLEGAVTNAGSGSYAVGSVQLSPGVPAYFRPPLFGFPTAEGPGAWYRKLTFGKRGKPNNGWYGPPYGSQCLTGCPDALSGGITEIDDFHSRYWTYRMEWRTGSDGGVAWYYDDEFVWSMEAASFGEYKICNSSAPGAPCLRTPKRQVPAEPMSLVMNTAIGTWNGGPTALDGKHWPASLWVDYVRVWQKEEHTGCDPPDYPTAAYIEKHADLYGEPAKPLGSETCPPVYPASAHEHAKAILHAADGIRSEFHLKDSRVAADMQAAEANAQKAQAEYRAAWKEEVKAAEAAAAEAEAEAKKLQDTAKTKARDARHAIDGLRLIDGDEAQREQRGQRGQREQGRGGAIQLTAQVAEEEATLHAAPGVYTGAAFAALLAAAAAAALAYRRWSRGVRAPAGPYETATTSDQYVAYE